MTRWLNHSGTAVSVPVVGRDVYDGEEVEVPDDAILPANYFSIVEDVPNIVPESAPVVVQDDEEQ